jgi:hypothetical protein
MAVRSVLSGAMDQFANPWRLAIEPIKCFRRNTSVTGLGGAFRDLVLKLHLRPAKLLGVQAFDQITLSPRKRQRIFMFSVLRESGCKILEDIKELGRETEASNRPVVRVLSPKHRGEVIIERSA